MVVLNQQEYDSLVRDLRQIMYTFVAYEIQDDPTLLDKDSYINDPNKVVEKAQGKHFISSFQKEAMYFIVSVIELFLCQCVDKADLFSGGSDEFDPGDSTAEVKKLFDHIDKTIEMKKYFGFHVTLQSKLNSITSIGSLIQEKFDLQGTSLAEKVIKFIFLITRGATRHAICHKVHTINQATVRTIVQSVPSFTYEPDLLVVL